jgi:hypothetical protein
VLYWNPLARRSLFLLLELQTHLRLGQAYKQLVLDPRLLMYTLDVPTTTIS